MALLALAAGCRTPGEGSAFAPSTSAAAVPAASEARPQARGSNGTAGTPVADGVFRAEIGAAAPEFELADLDGRAQRLSYYRGKIVVLEWFNPECPFVIHAYDEGPLREMHARYAAAGIAWITINSTALPQPGSDPDQNRAFLAARRLRNSIALDPSGVVGRTYGARVTPHLCVINERGALIYSGGLDNAPMGRVESSAARTNYVDLAIADLRSGHAVTTSSTHASGSPIRYGRP